jgi:hypothetical protein
MKSKTVSLVVGMLKIQPQLSLSSNSVCWFCGKMKLKWQKIVISQKNYVKLHNFCMKPNFFVISV